MAFPWPLFSHDVVVIVFFFLNGTWILLKIAKLYKRHILKASKPKSKILLKFLNEQPYLIQKLWSWEPCLDVGPYIEAHTRLAYNVWVQDIQVPLVAPLSISYFLCYFDLSFLVSFYGRLPKMTCIWAKESDWMREFLGFASTWKDVHHLRPPWVWFILSIRLSESLSLALSDSPSSLIPGSLSSSMSFSGVLALLVMLWP